MARTEITAQAAVRTGLSPTFTNAFVDGHMFVNNGRRALRIKNTDSSSKTVTVQFGTTVDGQTVPGKTITVPANTGDVVTDFWPYSYNQSDGRVYFDYSATTGVSVAVIEYSEV